jgi:uncharacterized membrane protein
MRFATETNRLEAFSDGVFAVIITIMVLELRPPLGTNLSSLAGALPAIATYAVSFVFVAIYWNNHHHMLRASRGIDAPAMWANFNLLFWLSLVPFSTAWLGRNPSAVGPTVLYSAIFLLNGVGYAILEHSLINVNGRDTEFSKALGFDAKGYFSLLLYVVAIVSAFFSTLISDAIIITVAIMWFIPDRRFEPLIDLNRK